MIRCYNISKKSCEHSNTNSWMLSGWLNGLTRGSKGCDVNTRGFIQINCRSEMNDRAILYCDPNKWWRCKVSLNICSLHPVCCYLRCSHRLFINQRLQNIFSLSRAERADNTAAVLWGHGNYKCKIRILFSHHHLACIPSSSWLLRRVRV